MARVAIPITVFKPDATNANAEIPAAGASVTVRLRSDNSLAPMFTTESGGSSAANPLTTDAQGRVTAWIARGAYKMTVAGSGITTYDEMLDAMPGSDGGIDLPALAGAAIPLDMVSPYAGSGDPSSSWMIADGRAISRTTYAALLAIIGTTYGVGDGSTTFNIPDLVGRFPLGAGTAASPAVAGGTAHALGTKGGEEKHVLTIAELASHTHRSNVGAGSGPDPVQSLSAALGGNGINLPTAGSDAAHNNLPQFTAVNYIVRVL